MKYFLPILVLFLLTANVNSVQAQVFPNPASLSTGQGTAGTLDPIWTVSPWYSTNPPNPMGLSYAPALINNNCAPGSWVSPASLPFPINNGNWITGAGTPCSNNYNDGYLYFRLTLNLPADCNGNSVATTGNYTLYLSGYADNTITDVFVNGNSTGINGGSYASPLSITLAGPWVAGINYVDVQVYNFPNGGNANPYGLLLVANSIASSVADGDGDGVPDINDQCPCQSGGLANGCAPVVISGDTIICNGESTTLHAAGLGTFLWSNGATADSIVVSPTTTTRYSVTATASNGYVDSAAAFVTVNQLPSVFINPASIAICNGASVTLTALGGNSFLWNTTATTQVIAVSPTITSSYTVIVTDANFCSATASSTVTVNQLPIAAINPATISICTGNSTTLTASGGTNYVWSSGGNLTTETVSPINNTTYSVTASDANSCTATASSAVTINALPVAQINPASIAICSGNSTTLTANGGINFLWSDGSVTNTISVSPAVAIAYSVTVIDANTCTATASSSVSVNALPVPQINPSSVSICNGNSTTLAATGGTNYLWSTASTNSTLTVSPNTFTTYSVTVTDVNLCSATASADVTVNPLPLAAINPNAITICFGTNTTLTATGGITYLWNDASTNSSLTVSPIGTTSYSVTVTDVNTCSSTASSTVTIVPPIALSVVTTNVDCNGNNNGSIDLTVTGGQAPFTFLWSNSSPLEDPINLAPANYTVIATDNFGCTATTSATITEPILLALTSSFTNPACETKGDDGTISLNIVGGTQPYQFAWSNGASELGLINLAPGVYDVTVSDANNCSTAANFLLAYVYDFTVAASAATTINLGGSANISYTLAGNAGNYVAVWSPASTLSCGDCVSAVAAPNITTLYQIEITNSDGCLATDTVTIIVIPDYAVYIPNSFTPNGDGTNDLFEIFGNLKATAFLEMKIFNRAGEKVFESNDHNFSWDGTYKGVKVNPGVFVWELKLTFINGYREEIKRGSLTLIR